MQPILVMESVESEIRLTPLRAAIDDLRRANRMYMFVRGVEVLRVAIHPNYRGSPESEQRKDYPV